MKGERELDIKVFAYCIYEHRRSCGCELCKRHGAENDWLLATQIASLPKEQQEAYIKAFKIKGKERDKQ